jgi:hypothetical protein
VEDFTLTSIRRTFGIPVFDAAKQVAKEYTLNMWKEDLEGC